MTYTTLIIINVSNFPDFKQLLVQNGNINKLECTTSKRYNHFTYYTNIFGNIYNIIKKYLDHV